MPYTAAGLPVYQETRRALRRRIRSILPAFPLDVPVLRGSTRYFPPIFAPFLPVSPGWCRTGAGHPSTHQTDASRPDARRTGSFRPRPALRRSSAAAREATCIGVVAERDPAGQAGGSADRQDAQHPDIATVLMLGPLVRWNGGARPIGAHLARLGQTRHLLRRRPDVRTVRGQHARYSSAARPPATSRKFSSTRASTSATPVMMDGVRSAGPRRSGSRDTLKWHCTR